MANSEDSTYLQHMTQPHHIHSEHPLKRCFLVKQERYTTHGQVTSWDSFGCLIQPQFYLMLIAVKQI